MTAVPLLPASDPEARLLDTPAGPVAVSDEGVCGATPVLCVHGIPGSRRDFRYLAPLLAERFRVLRVEMPGFGDSPPGREPTLNGWVRALLGVADTLGLERFALVAHSFGGGAALLAAAQAGRRLNGLGLLASMGARRHRAFSFPPPVFRVVAGAYAVPGLCRLLERATRTIYIRNGLPVPEPGDTVTLRRHVRLLASVRFPRLAAAARRVVAPALVAHAEDDPLVEVSIARELAVLLPRAELLIFPSGGHHINRTRTGEIAAAVARLFEAAGERGEGLSPPARPGDRGQGSGIRDPETW